MLEIPITYEIPEEGDCSPEYEYPPRPSLSIASKTDSAEGDSKKVCKQIIQLCRRNLSGTHSKWQNFVFISLYLTVKFSTPCK